MSYKFGTSSQLTNTSYDSFIPMGPNVTPFSISLIILSSIICIIGIMGNITIATVILKYKKMQTPINWFVFNLTISYLVIGSLTIPYNIINPFIDWPFGYIGCRYLIMPIMEHFASVCVLTHTAISLARYTVICKVGRKRFIGRKQTKGTIILIWLVSFFVLSVTLMGLLGEFQLDYDGDRLVCRLIWLSIFRRKIYRVGVFTLTYVIPMVITGYAYWRMHDSVVTSLRSVSGLLSEKILVTRRRRTRRMDVTLITMYVMFTVTTLPLQLFLVCNDFDILPTYEGIKIVFDLLMIIFYAQIISSPAVLFYLSYEYQTKINHLSVCCALLVPTRPPPILFKDRFQAIRRKGEETTEHVVTSSKFHVSCDSFSEVQNADV